jgi:catechol 2,3-dioxygenase-like lactoylglutathione lyase family enzyme
MVSPGSAQPANAPTRAVGLSLLVIYTDRPRECRDFYSALGLLFAHEQHGNGPAHYAATLPDGTVIELYPATARRPPSTLRLGFTTDGAAMTPPRSPGRHLLRDPDGRTVEIQAR